MGKLFSALSSGVGRVHLEAHCLCYTQMMRGRSPLRDEGQQDSHGSDEDSSDGTRSPKEDHTPSGEGPHGDARFDPAKESVAA